MFQAPLILKRGFVYHIDLIVFCDIILNEGGYRIVAITAGFQPADESSILSTRSWIQKDGCLMQSVFLFCFRKQNSLFTA